ncbi:hypothetical protein ACHJH3_06280 [Campylobacter sp. MOP7]|uniref:hypothetical protein n=1 Tax=Campylobacter canis TaxID=3378588 RepID=UPI00387EC164
MNKILIALSVAALFAFGSPGISFQSNGALTQNQQKQSAVKDESFAQIGWHSYQDMVAQINAQKYTKPVLLVVAQTTCQHCVKSIKDMQSDKKFIDFINANYHPVLVYQDKEQIDYAFATNFVPAFFVLDPATGRSLTPQPVKGAVLVSELHDYLERLKEAYDFYIQQIKK